MEVCNRFVPLQQFHDTIQNILLYIATRINPFIHIFVHILVIYWLPWEKSFLKHWEVAVNTSLTSICSENEFQPLLRSDISSNSKKVFLNADSLKSCYLWHSLILMAIKMLQFDIPVFILLILLWLYPVNRDEIL